VLQIDFLFLSTKGTTIIANTGEKETNKLLIHGRNNDN